MWSCTHTHTHDGMLLSHNMKYWHLQKHGWIWEYHAKQNMSYKVKNCVMNSYVGYKTKNNEWANKKNKQKLIDTDNNMVVTTGSGMGIVKGKGNHIYGERRRFDLVVWTQCNIKIMYHIIVQLKSVLAY